LFTLVRRIQLVTLVALNLTVGWAQGGAAAEEPVLQLNAAIGEAMQRNPDIAAAKARWQSSRAKVPAASALPDPQVGIEYWGFRQAFNLGDAPETWYDVSQEIPFPGKLRLRGEVAAREAERVEQEYQAVPLRIVARLKEAFYDLALVHTAIDIVAKNKLVLVDFEQTAQARYAVGKGVQQDVFRAQTEVSRLLARLAVLAQRQESLRAEINRLLNRPPVDPLGTPQPIQVTPLQHSLPALNALLEASSPLLQAQLKNVERGDQAVALARREFLPDFAVSVGGMRNQTMRKNGYQVMLGIKVPLYYTTKQREAVREALAGREAATQDARAIKQELLFRLKDNVAQAQRGEQLVAILTEAIIPQARLTLEAAQAGYAVGKVDFLTLLSSLLTLQDNELELHSEIVEHEKAVARLEEILGRAP